MKKLICILLFFLTLSPACLAQQDPQDPGIQDSLIVNDIFPDSGTNFGVLQIFAVTDDSVDFYNVPLRWVIPPGGGEIHPASRNTFFSPLTYWDDNYDTAMIDDGYIRQIGFCDLGGEDNPSLLTNGQRVNVWNIPLICNLGRNIVAIIDTTWDSRNGSICFGFRGGYYEITPGFRRGYIGLHVKINDEPDVPCAFSLSPNYPNPFNPSTVIGFTIDKDDFATLTVYDLLGRKIRSLVANNLAAGEYNTIWDGRDNSGVEVVSGIYYYRLSASDRSITNKMLLLR